MLLFLVGILSIVSVWPFDNNFSPKLTEIKSIHIPNDILIGGIQSFDFMDGNFVFTDDISAKTFLYHNKSENFIKLNPATCHPGFVNQPLHSVYNNQSILITNAQIQGYFFTHDGECSQIVYERFIAPFFITGYMDGFIGFTWLPNSIDLTIHHYDENGRISHTGTFTDISKPVLSLKLEGGGVAKSNNYIYLSTSASSHVYRYDPKNHTMEKFAKGYSEVYRSPQQDINEERFMQNYLREMQRLGEFNPVMGLFAFSEEYLLQTFLDRTENRLLAHYINLASGHSTLLQFPDDVRVIGAADQKIYALRSEEQKPGSFTFEIVVYQID